MDIHVKVLVQKSLSQQCVRRVACTALGTAVLGTLCGCATTARDEYYIIRSLTFQAEPGDRSALVPSRIADPLALGEADTVAQRDIRRDD